MDNKKRYTQVQRVVSPKKKRTQQDFIDAALKDASIMIGVDAPQSSTVKKKRPNSSVAGHGYGQRANGKQKNRAILQYEQRLHALSNVQGGGALISGHTYDMRSVIREIVKGYPEVSRQKAIQKREQAILERDEHGKPKQRTTEMLFDTANDGKESEFERRLYKAFEESKDPEQLIKILKRKLTMGDREMGSQQAKYLDEILRREPIRQFLLYARKCYYSDRVFDQIQRVNDRFGNEAEVYKNDKEFQARVKVQQLKAQQ